MDISRWVKESLILKILLFFTSPGLYDGSFFLLKVKSLGATLGSWYSGSVLRRFSLAKSWESSAVEHSVFARAIEALEALLRRAIDYINMMICHSHGYGLVEKLFRYMETSPFKTLSYVFLPGIFVSTAFKAVFSSFTAKGLALRIGVMAFLYAISFIEVSLADLINSSFFGRLLQGIWGELLVKSNSESTLTHSELRDLAIFGSVLGFLHFYLPVITLIKLLGAVIFSLAVYRWPGWGMIAAAFLLPLTATSYTVAIIGITFISVVLNYERYPLGVPCGVVPATFFLAIAGISAVLSFARADSLRSLPLYSAYFMVYYSTAVLYKDKTILKGGLASHIISATLVALYGIYQYFFIKVSTSISWVDVSQFPELRTRVYSTLENPNVLAEYLVLVLPLAIALWWIAKRYSQRVIITGIAGILFLCLILTFSRGAWIGMAFAAFVFAVLKVPGLAAFLVLLGIMSPALLPFLPPVVANRIASIGSLEDSSNAYRISIWIATLRIIRDYWFTGIGLGLMAFTKVYRDYMIAGTYALHSHNLFLQLALEMGIFGIIAFMWLVASGYSRGLVSVKKTHDSTFLLAGVLAALSGHLLHGLFEYIWYSPKVILTFWMTFGMISALASYADEASEVRAQ